MMRSCKEVSRLASERMDRKLSLRERMAFSFHIMMCRNCLRYARQLVVLRRATDKLRLTRRNTDSGGLPDEARERIAQRLPKPHPEDPQA